MSTTHVLVYQLGKVGSKAVRGALHAAGVTTFHMHRPELAAEQLRLSREGGHSVLIITGCRDLLARNISAFFENMSNPKRPEIMVGEAAEVLAMTPGQLIDAFNARHPAILVAAFGWFRKFEDVTGVDVFASPFPHADGFTIIDGPLPVAIYRQENLPAVHERICTALGLGHRPLQPVNVGVQKPYAALYRGFLESYRPGEATLDAIYGSAFMRHFYSSDEIDGLRVKWRGG